MPVKAISGTPSRLIAGTMVRISSVSPGVGQGEHRIVAGDHADVAVARLAGMHEEGGRAGAGQGGGDLAADMARFTHARDDDSPTADETNPAGACKLPPQAGQLRAQTVDLDRERLAAEFDEACIRIVGVHR